MTVSRKIVWMAWLLLITMALPGPAQATDISGTVVIKSKMRKRIADPRPDRPETPVSEDGKHQDEVRFVVVYIEEMDKSRFTVPSSHLKMLQVDRDFTPHVLPVTAGQTVDFPNKDKIFHSVYSESKGNKFELGEYREGDSRSRKFTTPGIVELFCNIHTNMNAYLVVLQNPFFSQPDASHTYTIKGVPQGTYTLHAWHPRTELQTKTVQVPQSGVLKVDFEI